MAIKDSEWLRTARELMYEIQDKRFLRDVWYDFLLWASYEVGKHTQTSKRIQAEILNSYAPKQQPMFTHLYQLIEYVVSENPRRNVPLRIMADLRLSGFYTYDEDAVFQILTNGPPDKRTCSLTQYGTPQPLNKNDIVWLNSYFHHPLLDNEIDNLLTIWNLGVISLIDRRCYLSGGSLLIAAANIYQTYCPSEYQERALLIPDDQHDRTFSLMAFLQLAMMGFPTYVLADTLYRLPEHSPMELLVPPTAICSIPCCSMVWNSLRLRTLAGILP